MSQSTPSANDEADNKETTISNGKVAVGKYTIQIKAQGGKVDAVPSEQRPALWSRPIPILRLPPRFYGLLDRKKQIRDAKEAILSGRSVNVYGQAGLGKTSLLRHLAYEFSTLRFPHGIVYHSTRHILLSDLLQLLFDDFYDSDEIVKATDAQIHRRLGAIKALIILDDVDLTRDDIDALLKAAPASTFLLASTECKLWEAGKDILLSELSPHDAFNLLKKASDCSVPPGKELKAKELCAALDYHPLRLVQAAAMAWKENCSLAGMLHSVQSASFDKVLATQIWASLYEAERNILLVLAALDNASLHSDHLSALTKNDNVKLTLQSLQKRGLIHSLDFRYTLAGGLEQNLRKADVDQWAKQALDYFSKWAKEHHADYESLLEEADAILQTLKWAAQAKRWKDVLRLGRAIETALILGKRWGAWEQVLDWILEAAHALKNRKIKAWALHQKGTRALGLENKSKARGLLIEARDLRPWQDWAGTAVTRNNLSYTRTTVNKIVLIENLSIPSPPIPWEKLSWKKILFFLGNVSPGVVMILYVLVSNLLPQHFVVVTATTTPLLPSSFTFSPTPTQTPTFTPTPTQTPTFTPTPSPTFTPTPTNMPISSTPRPCGNPPAHWQLYTVQRGEGLYPLARTRLVNATDTQVGNLVKLIVRYNCLKDMNLFPGQQLYLPPLLPVCTPSATFCVTPTLIP